MRLKANDRRLIVGTEIVPSGRIKLQAELSPAFLVGKLWISDWIGDGVPERGAIRESVGLGCGVCRFVGGCRRRERDELELVSGVIVNERTRQV